MEKLIKRLIILVLLFYAGRWGVERFMTFVDSYYESREEMARQVGEKKAAEIQRTIEAGNARRAEELGRQIGPGNALQSVGTTPPVSGAAVRRQLDEAQSRRSEAISP